MNRDPGTSSVVSVGSRRQRAYLALSVLGILLVTVGMLASLTLKGNSHGGVGGR